MRFKVFFLVLAMSFTVGSVLAVDDSSTIQVTGYNQPRVNPPSAAEVPLPLSIADSFAFSVNSIITVYDQDSYHVEAVSDRAFNLQITMSGGNQFVLIWNPDPDAVSYKIFRYGLPISPNTSQWIELAEVRGTTYTDTMESEKAFYYVCSSSVLVQGGTFYNGTSNVTVSSFYMDRFETTQNVYCSVLGTNPSYFPNVINGPVESVTWFKAIEYCNRRSLQEELTPCYSYSTYGTDPDNWPTGWNSNQNNHTNVSCSWLANGYRLPTEAEWEFAARGGNQTNGYTYSGSNTLSAVAWYNANSNNRTHSIRTKAPNELGIYDMSGNVWEWVWDIYGNYPGGAQTNPTGAASGASRVRRGGSSWDSTWCAVSYRGINYATFSNGRLGFRVCRNMNVE